jgi:hypothetical protein
MIMVAGTRQKTVGGNSYHRDELYPYAKAFTEAAENILQTENYDLFAEPARAIRNNAVKESLREFFVNDTLAENVADYMTAEEIEEAQTYANELFENDINAMNESAYMSEYMPMVGMALPIHKLILMNNAFSQGGGIQKVVAVQPAFTVSLERRILVTPDGKEIDFFLEQNKIADAIDATVPMKRYEISLPEDGDTTDVFGDLGGAVGDELSAQTHVTGIFVQGVYLDEGDFMPDAEGWYTTKGTPVTEPGTFDVWFHVDYGFTPSYCGPNRLERVLTKPITIKYKTSATATATLTDTLFGTMNDNKITLTTLKNNVKKVRLDAKLSASNVTQDLCSVRWKVDSDYVEIPEATPINTTVTPEEVKDVSAMYDANQVTKIMSMTKTALSEYKDKKIKTQLDESYARLDERTSFYDTFDFAVPEGYALDYVTHRMNTFMDMFDDFVTRMLQVLNDTNMTVTIYGDPRIVRRITPTEHTYQAPSTIGPMKLDYTLTIVDTKDNRVYNFVGADKLRNTNELMVILNPRNTERICYRIYDYQMYISNEIRNPANPALPAIHSFERWKLYEFQPVQGRIQILHPSGKKED